MALAIPTGSLLPRVSFEDSRLREVNGVPPALIDALELDTWSNRRDAEAYLPELLRLLVRATIPRISRLHFPSGEGVRQRGPDGVLVADDANEYVPLGPSTWEFGTSRDPRRKANEDYANRTEGPLGFDTTDAAFIFVTPRPWDGHLKWAEEKTAEGRWREVRAYDAHDLEAWLQIAPAVHAWISRLAGKPLDSARALSDFWESWRSATRPPLPAEFVLAGRTEIADQILERLAQGPSIVPVKADSIEESVAFLAASLQRLGETEREQLLSRTLVVSDPPTWNWAVHAGDHLLLVPLAAELALSDGIQAGHDVFVPVGRDVPTALADVLTLPRLDRTVAAQVLQDEGLSESRSARLSLLGRRNLLSLRRSIAHVPRLERPDWAKGADAHDLLGPSLCSSWDETVEGDGSAVAIVAAVPYDSVSQLVTRWSNDADPPLRRVGNKWYVVNKEDSWILLAPSATSIDLNRFSSTAHDVLRSLDPALELSPEEMWKSGMPEHARPHSALLREGIADTLAMIASLSGEVPLPGATTGQAYVDGIVRGVLRWDDDEIQAGWSSLSDVLPLLAEASPDVFLDTLDDALTRNPQAFVELLRDPDGSVLFASSRHTGLLWGLENLAWDPELLGRVALTLARLAALDPGGRWMNRPGNSLREAMLLWRPQTRASLDDRMKVMDALRDAGLAWEHLVRLLPRNHDVGSPSHSPRWRSWKPERDKSVSISEWMQGIKEVTERVLDDIGDDQQRWGELVKALSHLPGDLRSRVADRLESLRPDVLADEHVREPLRELVSRHRRYSDADWAMPKDEVDRLATVLDSSSPDDPVRRHAWLFTHRPDLVDVDDADWAHYRAVVQSARTDAIRSVFATAGVPGVIDLTAHVELPWEVGRALAGGELLDATGQKQVLKLLGDSGEIGRMAEGFTAGRFESSGWSWADHALADTSLSVGARTAFLLALPQGGEVWDRLDRAPEEVRTQFWSKFMPWGLGDGPEYIDAVARLLEHGRPYAAVEALGVYGHHHKAPIALVIDALKRAVSAPVPDSLDVGMFAHYIGELLDALRRDGDVDDATIAGIEWSYLPLLRHEEKGTPTLHGEMSRNPAFFTELVCSVYKGDADQDRESTDAERTRAEVAWELLHSWNQLPGVGDDGSVNAEAFTEWVDDARQLVREHGRAEIGDEQIGHILRYAPVDQDGAWPYRAVRQVVEDARSQAMEEGLEMEIFNSRGVTSRGLRDGGDQERVLVDRYLGYAAIVEGRWPRTAALLRRVADTFDRDAQRHDLEAESREELWGG